MGTTRSALFCEKNVNELCEKKLLLKDLLSMSFPVSNGKKPMIEGFLLDQGYFRNLSDSFCADTNRAALFT